MSINDNTTVDSVEKPLIGANINLKTKIRGAFKLESVMYTRTVPSGSLILELFYKRGTSYFLIRRLSSFVDQHWIFVPNMVFGSPGEIIFKTIGAGAIENHHVIITTSS